MPSFETINPATGERIASYELFSSEKAFQYASKGNSAFQETWKKFKTSGRLELFQSLAKSLRSKKSDYAKIMTLEMGKPITQSESEVEKCAWTAELYANRAEQWMAEEFAKTDADESYVAHEPLGLVLSIMPWNFPFWQAFRFAIPALVMGNTTILRHSNICPGSALAIEEAFQDAGFSSGVFSTIITDHDLVSRLISSDLVRGVSLTGSVEAGRKIGELAGRNLKKFVLELGGSDPFIVFEDADIEKAAKIGAEARLINSGQSCIAAKRFIVVDSIAKEFSERFVSEFEKKKVGDPLKKETDVGPLVSKKAADLLYNQVKKSIEMGAKILTGGKEPDGAFFEPTVLTNVRPEMPIMCEEAFGPVAPIYSVKNEAEAIRVANDSEYGLGASLWTRDFKKAKSLAREIESGMVFVNALVKSDARMPFGGIKNSGIGRELSRYGLLEFSNTKSINIYGSGESKVQ